MGQMMILNPKRRGRKGKKPSPAQLAARKKFIEMAKARRSKSKPKKRRKASTAAKRHTVKLNPGNPMAKKSKRRASRRRRSVASYFRRRKGARRNPIMPRNFMDTHLQPALIGAGAAVVNDMAVGKLVGLLPASLQTPEARHLVKGISAIGLSMLAAKAKVANSTTIRQATVGMLTCVLHDAGRTQAQKFLPSIALGEYLSEVIGPWQGQLSYAGDEDGVGEYLSGSSDYTPISYEEETIS